MGGGEGLGPILNLTLAGKRRAEKCWYLGLAIYSPLVAARINSVLSLGLLLRLLMNTAPLPRLVAVISCLLCPPFKWCFLCGLDPLWALPGRSCCELPRSCKSDSGLLSSEGKQSAAQGKNVFVKLKLLCLLCFPNFCAVAADVKEALVPLAGFITACVCPSVCAVS